MLVKFQLGFVWQRTRNTYNNFNKSCLCALWGTGLKNKYFFTKFCWPTTWNNTFDMIWLNIKEHICQHLENRLGFGVSVMKKKCFLLDFLLPTIWKENDYLVSLCLFETIQREWYCQTIIRMYFSVLVPNCPFSYLWCQIVRFYYLGAKLSYHIYEYSCMICYSIHKYKCAQH